MKTVKLTSAVLAIALCIISFTSCKKDSLPPMDNKTLLVGFWNMTQIGMDENKDGQIQQAEIFPVPNDKGYFIQFFEDGTGNVYLGQPSTMTWTMVDDNTIKLVYANDGGSTLFRIKTLTMSMLSFEDTQVGSTKVDAFVSCTKQTK